MMVIIITKTTLDLILLSLLLEMVKISSMDDQM